MKSYKILSVIFLFAFILNVNIFLLANGADIYHVRTSGNDANNGLSWAQSFATLQEALDIATSGDQIWVAEGTYYPSHYYDLADDNDRLFHFRMKNGVAIYGGFPASGDPNMGNRDWEANQTILSGDIGVPGDYSDNCIHVFYHPTLSVNSSAILDGFTITGGNANIAYPNSFGGGMHNWQSSPTINNCKFINNRADQHGGGIFNIFSSSIITNTKFINNSAGATSNGGGMNNWSSFITIDNCQFIGNTANGGAGIYHENNSLTLRDSYFYGNTANFSGAGLSLSQNLSNSIITNCTFNNNVANYGGAISIFNSDPKFVNCLIANNTATFNGGAIWNFYTTEVLTEIEFINCTIANNTANDNGGGINNYSIYPSYANTILNNCILWGNTANQGSQIYNSSGSINMSYTCFANNTNDVAGAISEGDGNIYENPKFVGSGLHPFSLSILSPCIDAGSNSLVPGGIATDILGNNRFYTTTTDMGAYELKYLIISGLTDITPALCYGESTYLVHPGQTLTISGSENSEPVYTYSWTPTFLVEHSSINSPVAMLTRAIRTSDYYLIVTDQDGMQGAGKVNVSVLPYNVISNPGTVVHSFRAEAIEEPLDLFELALGDGYDDIYDGEDYDLEFECRLGWLPPGAENCEEFDPTSYLPLPNSRLYGWIIIKHTGGCEADRRRINVIVRGNELGENEE